jgi:hypothetical protein
MPFSARAVVVLPAKPATFSNFNVALEAVTNASTGGESNRRLFLMDARFVLVRAAIALSVTLGIPVIPSAHAQSTPAPAQASAGPAWSPAQNIGMFAFPKNGQSADQQLKDESECYGMAKQRTGIDAQAPPPQGLSEEEKKAAQQQAANNAPKAQGGRARGAARGAAGGAAIGAIAGDAGKGAGAGAVAGTMKGGMSQRQANAQSKQQAAAQTAAQQKKAEEQLQLQHQEGIDTFQRAFAACMDARNYSVK